MPYDEALHLAREKALQALQAQLSGEIDREQLFFEEYTDKGAGWIRAVAEIREEISMVRLRRP
jgi:hypothetical protein